MESSSDTLHEGHSRYGSACLETPITEHALLLIFLYNHGFSRFTSFVNQTLRTAEVGTPHGPCLMVVLALSSRNVIGSINNDESSKEEILITFPLSFTVVYVSI